ncbi:Uncharacterised protein [Acidipropionibacterium jensenii]|uniref:Head-to-tail adaptor n=1 Tax=Acidipropionibacterium jensenii TaxID=1749 RepID=A0A3S4UYR1_9ACTN|nr:hypothetical protein [Acidipropionibacterium jensenii]VEI03743.1 Uncharacterised protein [Acidipropionibacterium jensenii]
MALSSDALTTSEDVISRLEDDIDDVLATMIEAGIEEISDEARDFGSPSWNARSVPKKVGRMCASAVAIWIRNPASNTMSRADDESLSWSADPDGGKPHFTQDDRERIAKIGTPYMPAVSTVQVSAWETDPQVLARYGIYSPTTPGVHPFLCGG